MRSTRKKEKLVVTEAKSLNRRIFKDALAAHNTAGWNSFIGQINLWITKSFTDSIIYGVALGKQSLGKALKLSLKDRLNRVLRAEDLQLLRVQLESDAARWSEPMRKNISQTLSAWTQHTLREGWDEKNAADILREVLKARGFSPTSARDLTNSFVTGFHMGYNGIRYVETRNNPDVWGYRYQTAGDERVRETHVEQQGTTLPKEDPFWMTWWPPNGYGCRCTTDILTEPENIVEPDRAIVPDSGFARNPFSGFLGL